MPRAPSETEAAAGRPPLRRPARFRPGSRDPGLLKPSPWGWRGPVPLLAHGCSGGSGKDTPSSHPAWCHLLLPPRVREPTGTEASRGRVGSQPRGHLPMVRRKGGLGSHLQDLRETGRPPRQVGPGSQACGVHSWSPAPRTEQRLSLGRGVTTPAPTVAAGPAEADQPGCLSPCSWFSRLILCHFRCLGPFCFSVQTGC